MDYEGWQLDNVSLSENVQRALDMYRRKHGNPPNILEASQKNVPLPEGVVLLWINLPENIWLLGTLIQN